MSYANHRATLKTAMEEITDFSAVQDYFSSEAYVFPTCVVVASNNFSVPHDSHNDLLSYNFDITVYDEVNSQLDTTQENEDRMVSLADQIIAKLKSLTVDHFGGGTFHIDTSGGFGYDEIARTRVRFFKTTVEIRQQYQLG